MAYDVTIRELDAQPTAVERRRVAQSEIGQALAEVLPDVMRYLQAQGVSPVGPPFARYHTFEPEGVEFEAGFPVAAPVVGGDGVAAGELPGGKVAVTEHLGPYDAISAAYEAIDSHVRERGLRTAGAPWEVYVTDPGEIPDPAQWRTEVVYPVASA